jgi:nucleoside-triphosphatase THEP1
VPADEDYEIYRRKERRGGFRNIMTITTGESGVFSAGKCQRMRIMKYTGGKNAGVVSGI